MVGCVIRPICLQRLSSRLNEVDADLVSGALLFVLDEPDQAGGERPRADLSRTASRPASRPDEKGQFGGTLGHSNLGMTREFAKHYSGDRQMHTQTDTVKGKVFPYSLPSVGPGADPGVQAVSPQVT